MSAVSGDRRVGPQARVLAVLVAALVAFAGPVAAQGAIESALVRVAKVEVTGPVTEAGSLDLFHAKRAYTDTESGVPTVTITGASARAVTYTSSGHEASTGQGDVDATYARCQPPLDTLGSDDCVTVKEHVAQAATVTLTGVQAEYALNLFGDGLSHTATYNSGQVTPMQDPAIDQTGPYPHTGPEPSQVEHSWTIHQASGAHLYTEPASSVVHLVIRGTFTLEVLGADFVMKDAAGTTALHSGVEREAIGPLPEDPVHSIHRTFLRLEIQNGQLDIAIPASDLTVRWTTPQGTWDATGLVDLEQATGTYVLADGTQADAKAQTLRLSGDNSVALRAEEVGMAADARRVDTQASRPDSAALSSGLSWLLGGISVLVVVLGALVVLAIRRTRHPLLADVEAAIEAGHYRRAAADASRILRRRPDMEDALLSRAIALCKAGRPGRVVAELRRHLASAKPTDGSLHYVLGLAFMDLGQRSDAEAVFAEAVRRTPALLTDVQGKLGVPGVASRTQPPLPGVESTHGYA